MKHRLRRIGVLKAGLMTGLVYAILSLLFVPFFFFMAMLPTWSEMHMGRGDWMFGPAFALLMPFIYAIFGFIGGAITALIYNLVAMMVGGLDIELEPAEPARPAGPATPAM